MALEEEGTIISISDGSAVVAVGTQGSCESCPSASVCHSDGDERRITAINPVNAQPGQKVKVVMHAQMYLKGTILVYAVPMIILIAGAIFGKYLADNFFPDSSPDLMAAGVGFTGMVLAFLGAKYWSKGVENKEEYQPVIEKILD